MQEEETQKMSILDFHIGGSWALRAKPDPQGSNRKPGETQVNVEEDEDPQPKKTRGKPAAKDNWLKAFLLVRH